MPAIRLALLGSTPLGGPGFLGGPASGPPQGDPMPTTSFSSTQATYSGHFLDDVGAQPYRQFAGGNARADLTVTGTALVVECYIGTGGQLWASVDGGPYADVTPATLDAFTTATIFTGLGDAAHRVTLRPLRTAPGLSYLQRDAATYRVTGASPACVPYAGAIPSPVICDGNSTTHGFGTTSSGTAQPDGSTYPDSYPNQLQALLGPGYEVVNLGVDGRFTETQAGAAAANVDVLFYANVPSWYVPWEAYNSILGLGDSAAAAWSAMAGIVSGRKAVGFKVALISAPVAAYGGTTQADYDAQATANAPGADRVILPSAIPALLDTADAGIYNGAPHMTRAGYGVIAAAVAAAISPAVLPQILNLHRRRRAE